MTDDIYHYGVKGMKWGVRKDTPNRSINKKSYRQSVYEQSPGPIKTRVITKTGEKVTITKEPPSSLALAVGKLTKRNPPDYISTMNIMDGSGKKVGSFQIWKENKSTIRGEWLSINKKNQGRGYSQAAIEGLIMAAKKNPEIKTIKAEVPRNAEAAKHIYGNLGFKPYKRLGDTPQFGMIDDWKLDIN